MIVENPIKIANMTFNDDDYTIIKVRRGELVIDSNNEIVPIRLAVIIHNAWTEYNHYQYKNEQ